MQEHAFNYRSDVMSLYTQYYYTASQVVAEIDLIEIQHPRFNPTVFRLVRNYSDQQLSTTDLQGLPKRGVIVMHEGAAGPFEYEYMPLKIERMGSGNDLDQAMRITLGDLGDILPLQLSLVDAANSRNIKPILRYRAYRSDDLTQPMTTTPAVMQIDKIAFNKTGCSFEAVAPYLNATRTGIIYDTKRFKTMKAFFKN